MIEQQEKQAIATKDELWVQLGRQLTHDHSTNVAEYMATLLADSRMEEFMDYYFKLLQYFKPKIQAHAVKQQTEIILRFEPDDKALLNDI